MQPRHKIDKSINSGHNPTSLSRLRFAHCKQLAFSIAAMLLMSSSVAQMPKIVVNTPSNSQRINSSSLATQPPSVAKQIDITAELSARAARKFNRDTILRTQSHSTQSNGLSSHSQRSLISKPTLFQRSGNSALNHIGNVIQQPSLQIRQPKLRPKLTERRIPAGLVMFQLDGDPDSEGIDPANQELLNELLRGLNETQSERIESTELPKTNEVQEKELEESNLGEVGEFVPVEKLPLPKKLPEPEVVIPIPTIQPDEKFRGFGDFQRPPKETLPNPNAPPAYQWPPRPPETNLDFPPPSSLLSTSNVNKPWQFGTPQQTVTQHSQTAAVPAAEWNVLSQEEVDGLLKIETDRLLQLDDHARPAGYSPNDFLPTPVPRDSWCPTEDIDTYYGKRHVPTQRPLIEIGRPFYGNGILQSGRQVFSDVNPVTPSLLVYGDYRTGVGIHRVDGEDIRSYAHRLNLDINLQLTGTERLHAFIGPLDENGQFTRLDFSDSRNVEFEDELDVEFNTGFFEGDAGAILGSITGNDAPFDLPFTFGLVPLIYQNGIWLEDAVAGGAISFPWKHSRLLNWANFDATFFAGFDQVTSAAFDNDDRAAIIMGTAWFIEAYDGYIEADYAYLSDQNGTQRSYHNFALAYTRRYFDRVSNSIRYIGNVGQQGPRVDRTADGGLFLIENALISSEPNTIVPYANFFIGHGTPQSAARAAGSGSVLRNTGISFETDGLTGSPTLDATGHNAYGGAVGINLLSGDFTRQMIFEFAALDTYGNPSISSAPGAQYGFATRYQKALNNWSQIRADLIGGILDNSPNFYGSRIEFRWKF